MIKHNSILLFILLSVCITPKSQAQIFDHVLDANNISITLDPTGTIAYGTMVNNYCHVPAGQLTSPLSASWLWLAGADQMGVVRDLCPQWELPEEEIKVGPWSAYFDNKSEIEKDLAYIPYRRVWKISKAEIEYHKQHFNDINYWMPEAIANWPGSGDTSRGFAHLLAPFTDFNNNKIYEPISGDYPNIKGDLAIFAMYNDHAPDDISSFNPVSDLEVHVLLYAFYDSPASLLGNTIFANYNIINRGTFNYGEFYAGILSDFSLGYTFDDYVGCDSSRNLFYVYNGDNSDDSIYGGYGTQIPAFGCVSLNMPLHSFMYRPGDNTIISKPITALERYYCLDARFRDGSHMIYGGIGYDDDGGIPTNYMYSSDPRDMDGWSEYTENNPPWDRRGYAGIGPYVFAPGENICLEFAYVFAQPQYPSDRFEEIDLLKNYAGQLNALYPFMYDETCLTYITDTLAEQPDTLTQTFSLYPNPSHGEINFILPVMKNEKFSCEVYDITGKLIYHAQFINTKDYELHTLHLPFHANGLYILRFNADGHEFSEKVVIR